MRNLSKPLLVALAFTLALWLVWGFWPLGFGSRLFLSVVVLVLAGGLGWRYWRQLQNTSESVVDIALPPEDFEGALVLVCGDSDVLFSADETFRETRQGWHLPVRQPEQLAQIAESVASGRPALVAQVSVLLALAPERWQEEAAFSSRLHQWQRAIAQSRRSFAGLPPVWTCLWLNAPAKVMKTDTVGISSPTIARAFRFRKTTGSPNRICRGVPMRLRLCTRIVWIAHSGWSRCFAGLNPM